MAPTVTCAAPTGAEEAKQTSVKALLESDLNSIPSRYFTHNETGGAVPEKDSIPVIDFTLVTSADPDQRSRAIEDMGRACEEWGFFMLVNHGVPESVMQGVLDGCHEFFNLPEEAKKDYQVSAMTDVWAPIRTSSGVDSKTHKAVCWRDFLKTFTHPTFNFPTVLPAFHEIAKEYNKRTREISKELLKGISEHLGLEENYINQSMDFDSGFQVFSANCYPPCPQPEAAMGIPAHTDHGIITLLIQNGIGGLQIQHKGTWFNVDPLPNCFLVNTCDHLEVLSNGKYKSVWHRAVVNSTTTRISIAVAHGPPLDKVVGPAPELLNRESQPPAFKPMMYKEYMELQMQGKHALTEIRIQPVN